VLEDWHVSTATALSEVDALRAELGEELVSRALDLAAIPDEDFDGAIRSLIGEDLIPTVTNIMERAAKRCRRTKSNLASVSARVEDAGILLTLGDGRLQAIADVGFRGENLLLAVVATQILHDEHPVTLRGLMYRVVSAGFLPATDHQHYTRLGRLMTRLREAGAVPFSWIVDGVRSTDKPSSWSGLADYAQAVRDCYRLNLWEGMDHYVHFVVEKDAVAGTLSPVTREYDVALSPIRGYSSLSFAHEIAETWNEIRKPIFCYYLGDFDPSGFDLQRDLQEKLKRYCNREQWFGDGENDHDADDDWCRANLKSNHVMFRRLAVIQSDFEDFDLLPLAVKDGDKRAKSFRRRWGDRCAELDAIPSTELRRRIRDTIEAHITNRGEWERLQTVEQAEKETVEQAVLMLSGGRR
jgi:hypothetical protein